MVGKKKNFIKCFLCFLFAVILPFSFVACKKDSSPDNDDSAPADNPTQEAPKNDDSNDENNDNKDDEKKDEDDVQQEPNLALNIEKVAEILDSSEEKLDEFIAALNDSDLLEENNLDENSTFIICAKDVIKYAYYPSYLIDVFGVHCANANTDFELDKVFQFSKDGGSDYIEFYTIDENRIIIDLVSHEVNSSVNKISYYCYDFTLTNGQISSMKVSNYSTGLLSKKITFKNAIFDFENLEFIAEFGKINNHNDDAETFFKNKFNKENFSIISSSSWTYTNFGYFKFGNEKQVTLKENKDAREEIQNQFDTLGFLSVFDKYNEFEALDRNLVFGLVDDYRGYIEEGNLISITYDNYAFKTNEIN